MELDNSTYRLCVALQQAYSPKEEDRANAESILSTFKGVPGFALALFQLLINSEVDIGIRQSGAIYFKNLVKSKWRPIKSNSDIVIFTEDTQKIIKENLLPAIATTPKTIRVQLLPPLQDIIESDFPYLWPNLLPQVIDYINSQDTQKVKGALYTFRILSKSYEWVRSELEDKKTELNRIVELCFPVLIQLFDFLMKQDHMESIEMQLLLCKIFWSCTQLGMPPYCSKHECIAPWIEIFLSILSRPITQQNEPTDPDEREKWPPWNVKKWASTILDKIVHRSALKDNAIQEPSFTEFFQEKYSSKVLETFINVLTQSKNLGPRRFTTACLTYVNRSLYHSRTWKLVKPHMDNLFQSLFFPILYFTEADLALYNTDPHEFIRQQFDFVHMLFDPRAAVLGFMIDTIKLRGDDNLYTYMNYLVNVVLARYVAAPPSQKNLPEKDAALVSLGNLAGPIKNSKVFRDSIEDILTVHVLPEFNSPHGFMRARACWILGQFADIEFKIESNFVVGVQSVLKGFEDRDLPVRIYSALTLRKLLRSKIVHPMLEPILPQLVQAYMQLMDEIDNDDIVEALQTLIKGFNDKLTVFAPMLTNKLVEQYERLIARKDLFEDDDQSGMLTAMQILKAIQTLLESFKNDQTIIQNMQPYLRRLTLTLAEGQNELYTDQIDLVAMYSFFAQTIHDSMWDAFERLCECCSTWAREFLPELLVPFDNFISKSPDKFLSADGKYLNCVCRIYELVMNDKSNYFQLPGEAAKLIEVVLINCRGRVDHIVPRVIELAVLKLKETEIDTIKLLLLEVVVNALYYNPSITLSFIESKGWTKDIFTLWFQMIPQHFVRLHDLKLTLLSLSSIFLVPYATWPQAVKNELKTIFLVIMDLSFQYNKQKLAPQGIIDLSEQLNLDIDDSKEEVETKLGFLDDEDEDESTKYADEEDIDAAYYTRMIETKLGFLDDEDEDIELEDDSEFSSLIDGVDELLYFMQAFQSFSHNELETYQKLMISLTEEEKDKFKELTIEANKRTQNKT